MSGAPGDDNEDIPTAAAELVLGLLDERDAAALRARAALDPALAREIADWELRLSPLADLAAPSEPGDLTWARIRRSVEGPAEAPVQPAAQRRSGGEVGRWRAAALASMVIAGVLGTWVLLRPPSTPSARPWTMAAALLSTPGSPVAALRARVMSSGDVVVQPLVDVHVERGRRLEFWAWPRGRPGPIPLGAIPAFGGRLAFPYEATEGTAVMVTSEPSAGPGATPGPTLYLGLLVAQG